MKRKNNIIGNTIAWVTALVVALVLAVQLSGCKSVQTVVEVREKIVHDTTQVVDSVYRDRVQYVIQKGDTVYKTDSTIVYKYKTLERVKVETVRDSIPYSVEVVKEVHIRSGYDRFVSWGFWSLIVLLLLFVAWKVVRWYMLRK